MAMRSLLGLTTGPAPTLPDAVDRVAERWAAAPPRLRWAVGAAAVVVALGLTGRGAVASPWGPPVDVVVAATDLHPGQTLDASHVSVTSWPRDLVDGVALEPGQVVGAIARRQIRAGEPIALGDVHDGGLAAQLGPGRAAVPVTDAVGTPATPGWLVDVVGQGYDGSVRVLANAARVLAADGERVWLEVAREEAPAVVAASARGDASLVLLSPG